MMVIPCQRYTLTKFRMSFICRKSKIFRTALRIKSCTNGDRLHKCGFARSVLSHEHRDGGIEFDKFLLENRENYWELTEAEIKKSFPNSFKFTSQKHDELRYNMRESKNKLTIKKFVVPEVVFSFTAGKVSEITVSIFNRGDYQFGIKKEAAILKMFDAYVGGLGGKVIESQKRRIEKTNVVYKRFGDEFNDYVYMVGNSDRGVEFINLKIVASGKAKSIRDMFKTRVTKLGNLTLNLQDDGAGGVYLDIPMVDQGQKGYCVCATVERILKYYQSDVDQHILAQIMKTEQQGTSLEVAMEALDGMRAKLRIKSNELIKNEAFNKVQDFEKVTKKYNRLAKRQKRNTIEFDEFIVRNGNKKSLEVDRLFSEYEYDLFRDVMCEDEMKQEIANVSTQLTGKLLEREINEEDHRNLIDSFLNDLD